MKIFTSSGNPRRLKAVHLNYDVLKLAENVLSCKIGFPFFSPAGMIEKTDIEKLKQGDRVTQEKVYKYYSPKLKSLCLRYSKSSFEAEDIFQEAFIKIFTRMDKYKHDFSFEGWIKRIVVNTAIDYYKKNLKFNKYTEFEDAIDVEFAGADVLSELSVNELLEIIQKLPEGYRLIFNMYEIEGYTHKEISSALNISEGTSKSQLFKAKRFIQTILKKYKCIEK